MKKLVVLVLALILSLSVLPYAVFADGPDAGGLDFYSVTITYEEPIVVAYREVTAKDKLVITKYKSNGDPVYGKGYVFADPADSFVCRAGYATKNAYTFYQEKAAADSNFYEVVKSQGDEASVRYTKVPYKWAYITSINDGAIIRTKSAVNFYGITAVRDDAKNPNPNLTYNDKGYALAQETDASGAACILDDNGFILDSNFIWHDSEGRRIEPFYQDDEGNYVWIPIADRYDARTGRIMEIGDMGGGIGAELFRVVVDYNADEKFDAADFATAEYNDPATVFTVDNILRDNKDRLVRGSPVIGTPQTKAKIKSITIEIDALGSQLYSDAASDPQNKNTITLTVSNPKDYIEAAAQYGDTVGYVLGTVNSKTTKTEMDWSKNDRTTPVSIPVDVDAETLAKLPELALLYLEFHIETKQDAAAYDEAQILDDVTTEAHPVYSTPAPTEPPKAQSGCKEVIVSGTVVAAIALLGACVVLKKKRH
ncbi:MAG: hypothetical protein II748_03095 [Clostridia bacterium]|nr:hypothetical protein [Clostridia bacterium]